MFQKIPCENRPTLNPRVVKLTSKAVGWRLEVSGSVEGVDGTEESSWPPLDVGTTAADLVSSDAVPDDRTNGAGFESRDHVAVETAAVAGHAVERDWLRADMPTSAHINRNNVDRNEYYTAVQIAGTLGDFKFCQN